jgi:hypothetical protein
MKNTCLGFALAIAMIFAAGCCGLLPQPAASNATVVHNATNQTPVCGKECFVSAANACRNASMLFANDAGTFNYSVNPRCIFTKTLLTLNSSETQEMKNLLQGKNMTCAYEKGKFDQRLVDSLIFGMEYCEGGLKEALGELIVFS